MTVEQLPDYLKQHGPEIREQLLTGTYEPKPVRRVEISPALTMPTSTLLDSRPWSSVRSLTRRTAGWTRMSGGVGGEDG
jgi:hypothetical protein